MFSFAQTFRGLAAAGALIAAASAAQAGETLDAIKARGVVACAVNTGLPGWSSPDSQGVWSGFDVDFCRAFAVALFNDPNKVRLEPTTSQTRFQALQSREVDVLTRNVTLTLTRDTTLGFHAAGVNFYDGQGFMVPAKMGVKSAKELNGATICVQPGTTTELNLADYFRATGMAFTPVVIEKLDEVTGAFFSGRCDAYTTDASGLAAVRAARGGTAMQDFVILPERISKEPLGPMVRKGDDQWFAIVKWTLTMMIEAEEYGVNKANVDQMLASKDPGIRRMLGVEPGFGKALGLDEKWAYNVIKTIGNYGDVFERNLGKNTNLKMERSLNALWTQGGLMYAIPLR
jgi:general L-amino acid transport system substrate-binding protein